MQYERGQTAGLKRSSLRQTPVPGKLSLSSLVCPVTYEAFLKQEAGSKSSLLSTAPGLGDGAGTGELQDFFLHLLSLCPSGRGKENCKRCEILAKGRAC